MTQEYYAFETFQPSKQHILNCSYSAWYKLYRDIAPPTTIVPELPAEFIEYLLSDGIWMPEDYYSSKKKHVGDERKPGAADGVKRKTNFDDDSDFSDWEEDGTLPEKTDPTLKFAKIHQDLHSVFAGGKSFLPKLNWSAPKDSTWILTNNSLKCDSVNDVYLLLKSSSFIVHDLTECFDGCDENSDIDQKDVKYDLILKEWIEGFSPSMEFRCFVKGKTLVAISQRDSATYYEFLSSSSQISKNLKVVIQNFYTTFIKDTFSDSSLVFDIYVKNPSLLESKELKESALTKKKLKQAIYLIDINPFHRKTDPLLFSWNEILRKEIASSRKDFDEIELRLVNQYTSSQFASKQYSENYVPKDMVDAVMDTQKMIELMKAYNQQYLSSDEEDEEEET